MPSSRRVDVIVNTNARGSGALRRAVEDAADRGGATLHATRSLEELDGVAQRIAQRECDAVILAGGDGSHMNALSALSRAWPRDRPLPPVALAPGGTMNTVARNLGMPFARQAWAERLVAAVCDGTAHARPATTLQVTDDRGGLRVGFIFGSALVARFFDLYDRGRPGAAGAARIAAKVVAGAFTGSSTSRFVLGPANASIRVDGVEHPSRRWTLILASVVPDLGLHMLATYRAGERMDRFHVVASGLEARALSRQLPRVLSGRGLLGAPGVDALAAELRVDLTDVDGAGAAYVMDGDVVRAGTATVSMGPTLSVFT